MLPCVFQPTLTDPSNEIQGAIFFIKKRSNEILKINTVQKTHTYPLGPASPSLATLRILPLLTPGGTLTLISFLIRVRPSPEHFRQYSEMTSPLPPHFGHTDT